jgi:hypothetical protein
MFSSRLPGIRRSQSLRRKSGSRVLAGVTYKSEDALTKAGDRWLPVASFCGNAGGKGRTGVLSVDGNATGSRFTPRARQRFQRAGS